MGIRKRRVESREEKKDEEKNRTLKSNSEVGLDRLHSIYVLVISQDDCTETSEGTQISRQLDNTNPS
tara:strand:+ start:236 stop:436 length:201 start_codon:yes stop_codon:yes gene_type:complete